jgi:peptide/nickel transport system permease protein
MGLVLVTAIVVVTVNLVVDLLQGFINPKVRLS